MKRMLPAMLLVVPTAAIADGLAGVWRGTIGTTEVQLCLQQAPDADLGAYYALADGQIVTLEADMPSGSQWHEASAELSATLTFVLQDADHLTGMRLGAAATRIFLTRVPFLPDDESEPNSTSCGSLTFSAARLQGGDMVRRTPSTWHGSPYTRLTFSPAKLDVHLESFQLAGTSSAIQAINAELAEGFPGLDPEADVLDCSRSNLGWSGRDGMDTEIRWPEILTHDLLVIGTKYEVYCGGAYPETSTQWQAINPQTGKAVDMTTWLDHGTLDNLQNDSARLLEGGEVPESHAFSRLFMQHYAKATAEDDGCADTLSEDNDWFIRPAKSGLIFAQNLPHVVQSCSIDVTIPYRQIWPFLSPSGKDAATAIREVLDGKGG